MFVRGSMAVSGCAPEFEGLKLFVGQVDRSHGDLGSERLIMEQLRHAVNREPHLARQPPISFAPRGPA
jgi:hypothetical protein